MSNANRSPATPNTSGSAHRQSRRVLHYMPTNAGMTGVETFILQLCRAQTRMGMIPKIILDLDGRVEVVDAATSMGVEVCELRPRGAFEDLMPRKLGTVSLRTRRIKHIQCLLKDSDVLHVHSVGLAGIDGLVAAWWARVRRVVVTHHTTISYGEPKPTGMSAVAYWLEQHTASRAVMPYSAAAKELIAMGFPAPKVSVVPFCFDEQRFAEAVAPPSGQQLTFLMSARLVEGKEHLEAIEAVARLHKRYPRTRLVLLGDGPERCKLEQEITRGHLAHVVQLKGRVAHSSMPAEYQQGHVIVLPTHMPGETFPLSLLEAAALGIPAIGSRWFGIPDIIVDGETGVVVEPRDVDALASAMERFIVEPSFWTKTSSNARNRALAHYTATAVAEAYAQIYAEA